MTTSIACTPCTVCAKNVYSEELRTTTIPLEGEACPPGTTCTISTCRSCEQHFGTPTKAIDRPGQRRIGMFEKLEVPVLLNGAQFSK